MPHAFLRVLAATSVAGSLLVAQPSATRAEAGQPVQGQVPTPVHAQAGTPKPVRAQARTPKPDRGQAAGVDLKPVPGVEEPSGAVVAVPERPSLALRSAGDDAAGPQAPEVTTPAGPALAREVSARAAAVQEEQGVGGRAPDVHGVLPDTAGARLLTLVKPLAPIAEVLDRLGEGAGERVGASKMTYRLCVESADVPVSCSVRRLVGVPAAADVTADDRPDLAATLVPAALPGKEVGLRFAVRRLGRADLKALVWAEYDGKVSVGFDGLRRGSSLSAADRGTFTVAGGRVTADVERTEPGASAAVVAGLTGRSAVSLRQSPATGRLTVKAALDPLTLDATASAPARLEALAVTGRRFTHAALDRMPARAEVRLSGGRVAFTGSAPAGDARVHDFTYRDGRLTRVTDVELQRVPRSFNARYTTTDAGQTLTVDAAAPAGAARLLYSDVAGTVLKSELSELPARLRLANDLAAHRVTHTASSPVGRFAVVLQRRGGALAAPSGSHVTMIKDGAALGVSALLTDVSGFDVAYGSRPHAHLDLASAGRSFVGAASVDRTRLARVELSNTPATVDVTLDPAKGTAAYRASGAIDRLRAAYADLGSGPVIDGTVLGVRGDVTAAWELGERSSVKVTTAAELRQIRIYAGKKPGPSGEDVRARIDGLREHAELVAAPGTLTWTADAPVAAVSALARGTMGGRYVRAAAEVRGVPARFDASWNPASYRFRGLSGPVGSAALAFTNHDGATAPTGPHLAAHHDQASGDLDASVQVEGLSHVEFGPSAQGFAAAFRAARQTLAVDADVTRGDDRFGLAGTLGPLPGRLAVSSEGGRLTYSGSRLDVRARAWLGKSAALARMRSAPAVPDGVSLVDGACREGSPGCAPGAFCLPGRGCFGLQAHLDVRGLPEQVSVDPATGTFTFSGFRPRRRSLAVYLDSGVLSPVPVKAGATLTGLPSTITRMSLGPFGAGGNAVRAAYRIEPAATLGALDVRAEAGGVRGHVAIDPVPAAVAVDGAYGARTRVRVRNSAAVRKLTAEVTVPGRGTGALRFADVPAAFGVDADASAAGLGVPAVTYKAEGGAGTLDGSLGVEGRLVDPSGRLGDVSLAVEDLAADTTIRLNPDRSLDLVSRPAPTGRVTLHAGLRVDPVAPQRVAVRKEVPYTGGFLTYHVGGRFALARSVVRDVSLEARRVSWLRVRPGRIPFGLKAPAALGYVTPGFEGAYGSLRIAATGVDLRPDIRLDVRLSREIGDDVFRESVRIGPSDSLDLRRYDQRMRRIGARQEIRAAGVGLACVTVAAKPGFAARASGGALTLRGADGPQMVSLLDLGGQAPDYAVDLLTSFMSPFPGADWQVSGAEAGGCRASSEAGAARR
ncbi:hypothetical protein [Nonomuraea terrae]|uniref:hypothetical protein n=1 Tax=Nonomuraea terrae TaxID=2530383 RepID=UPI001404727D|nr:hypothetical protein [Nonomuraea terrae]